MDSIKRLKELRENAQDVLLEEKWKDTLTSYTAPTRNDRIWLTSFTDVIALMLVFFVMMFSMSAPKESNWVSMVQSMNAKFSGGVEGKKVSGVYGAYDMKRIKHYESLNNRYLFAVLKNIRNKNKALEVIKLDIFSKKISLELPYNRVYQEGTALEITKSGRETFDALTSNIGHLHNKMSIELFVPELNIGNGLKQLSNIASLFKNAGYGGEINLKVHSSYKGDEVIKLFIHSGN